MGKIKRKWSNFRFKGILAIAGVYAMISALLLVELTGVRATQNTAVLDFLEKEKIVTKEAACRELKKNTLLLWSSADVSSADALEQFQVILQDMKVGYDAVDLTKTAVPEFAEYQVVIVMLSDLSFMEDKLIDLCEWVYEGGNAWFPLTLEQNAYASAIENKLGIKAAYGQTYVDQMYLYEDFMLGAGKAYAIPDAYDAARTVELFEDGTTVYAAEGNKDGVPLIWKTVYGNGYFVVDNFGMCDKAFRGFYAASLSLLTEVYCYPVINGSAFYLDDFPSQIPSGTNPYITKDYNTSVRDFYMNIWWPDMMNFCDKYGVKYTGLAIECYDNIVDGSVETGSDRETFSQIGNMLLRKGGEIGYHGYNHQPLALGNKDYRGIYDYKTWESYQAMNTAFGELTRFCDEIFPDVKMAVYVPPSNLLSDEGRAMLMKEYPQIKTYSGIYLPDDQLDFSLLQEYKVDENGVVDQPRIISGCDVDDFMMLGALSELNFHFVNDHFTHPDDALDPDRGAELGWEELKSRFDEYLKWLYESAPELRNMTGSELSAAVQRFAAVSPKQEIQEDQMILTIDHFYDNAQFMLRFNEESPQEVTGGKLTQLTGNLYLLEAEESVVTISFQ